MRDFHFGNARIRKKKYKSQTFTERFLRFLLKGKFKSLKFRGV